MVPNNRYASELRLFDTYFAPALQGLLASDLTDRRPAHVVAQALVFASEAMKQRKEYLDSRIAEAEAAKKAKSGASV